MNPAAIRQALSDQIAAGISRKFNCEPYPSTNPQFPRVTILSGSPYLSYHQSFGDRCLVGMELVIEVVTVAADGRSAWLVMDDVLAPGAANLSSIMRAVESNPTLGGLCGQAWVSDVTSGPEENESGHVVAELACHITANQV